MGCADLVATDLVDGRLDRSWCEDPKLPSDDGAPLRIVACRSDLDRDFLDRRLRAAGRDPLGTAIVMFEAWEATDPDRILARLAAETARVNGTPRTAPEHLKLVMPAVASRRTLLSFRAPSYRVVPRPDPIRCGASNGCRSCVGACPHGALEWVHGAIEQDRLSCAACGRCIAACPADAMVSPAFVPERVEEQIEAFGTALGRPFGVEFHCSRGPMPDGQTGWLQVQVPCVGMMRPHWPVAALLAGATTVCVSACSCGIEPDAPERVERTIAAARDLLKAADLDPATITNRRFEPLPMPIQVDRVGPGYSSAGASAVGVALDPVAWQHPLASAGRIDIDPGLCTGCEMCSTVCPSHALSAESQDGTLVIEFDARRCTACGQCVERCPEPGAIELTPMIDSALLGAGTVPLASHRLAMCVRCGESIAPEATLARLGAILGTDSPAFEQVSSVCLDCRGKSGILQPASPSA